MKMRKSFENPKRLPKEKPFPTFELEKLKSHNDCIPKTLAKGFSYGLSFEF